jgi:CheY-like chemotaxis protein
VEMQGGTLELESHPGIGTRITLRFVSANAASSVAAEPRATVLIVEDDLTLRATSAEILRSEGYRVREASGPREALEILRGTDPVDLIFSDMQLPPGPSGIEFVRQARHLRPGVRALLTSGLPIQIMAQTVAAAELPSIAKPYARDELVSRIEGLLGSADEAAEPAVA